MSKENIEFVIKRIEHMEQLFDEVNAAFQADPKCSKSEDIQKKVSLLTQYMESGQWLKDFTADENGELPSELKRGVLSEDGLYNLICDINKYKSETPSAFKSIINKITSFFKQS